MVALACMPSGIAAGSPMQPQLRGHPMLQRSHANAAQPPSLGCSRLPDAARVCGAAPVAAAGSGSGISSQAAGQALPNLLAFASAAVKAWLPAYAAVKAWLLAGGWLVALKLAAASAAVFFVLDSSAKAEFDRQCKHDEPSTVVKKVNAEFERLLLRVPDHLAIMVWTHVLCGVVLSGMTFVPAPHEAVLLWLGSGALSEAHEIIRAYRMLRHGKASPPALNTARGSPRLGVLKPGDVQWQPPLPATNQQALDQLSMGLLNKLVLVFPRVFWPRNLEVINRVAPSSTPGAWSETYNMLPHTGKPVLVAFNAAQYASQLEQKTAAQVKDEYMAVLRALFGAANVPEPISYTVTAWGKDPFARGSYSFTKSAPGGAFGAAHRKTAAPIANRIFFAGEHTRADSPATTHGALLSGRKAAADLLASLK